MHVLRSVRGALLVAAAAAVAGLAVAPPAHAGVRGTAPTSVGLRGAVSIGRLVDLDPTPGPLDGARAAVLAVAGSRSTVVALLLHGVDRAAAGRRFGAHVHVGPCVPGDPAAALGHYNTGGPPSPQTEVWLDVTVSRLGTALSVATVPFVVPAGAARSVVLHAEPTLPTGAAGPRLACLPVEFP